MWREHYELLLNSAKNNEHKVYVCTHVNKCDNFHDHNAHITANMMRDTVKSLKCGKTAGCDYLNAEHLEYADDSLFVVLAILFSSFIMHGHLTSEIVKTILVPLVKK